MGIKKTQNARIIHSIFPMVSKTLSLVQRLPPSTPIVIETLHFGEMYLQVSTQSFPDTSFIILPDTDDNKLHFHE